MQYRAMKSTGDELSILGFGCMRHPQKDGKIDEERTTRQIRDAIDRGVNYVDTAWPYHNGQSEPFLGRALADGYREKVKLATKMPHWYVETREDMDKILNAQLDKLKTDHVDYYLIHNLSINSWEKIKGLDFASFVEKAKADGKIKHIGFSSHVGIDDFKKMVDDFGWEFCQIQLNYLDEKNQAGIEGMEYAASKGLGVIVMEPLRGGSLSRIPPKEIQAIWDEADIERTPAEWGLRWIWNYPEVTVVLSGMNDEKHVEENTRIAGEALPGSLTEKELELVGRARDTYLSIMKVGCTGCHYCMPCPNGVNIPICFLIYNNKYMKEYKGGGLASLGNGPMMEYLLFVGGVEGKPGFASQCKACGQCVEVCPQHLDIPLHLEEVKKEFEGPGLTTMKRIMDASMNDTRRNMKKAKT